MSTFTMTVLGGGREIGANSYHVSCGGCNVVLDCGTHPKKEGYEAIPKLELLGEEPDGVLISHGHVDHCGALPLLLKQFPNTAAYGTRATVSIMDRMLHNSVSVMGIIARERNVAEYPLYEHGDVDYTMYRTSAMDYGERFSIGGHSGLKASFYHAGHVLGSASVLLEMPGHNVFYTGDVCVADQELLAGREVLGRTGDVDTLIIESTYGANEVADEADYEEETRRFADMVADVLRGGGTALIPAFALGRAQELLNIIARLQEEGVIPDVPVYVSGLGRAIYEIYDRYHDCLREGAELRPLSDFRRVGDVWNPKVARQLIADPCIIVATSGMMIPNTPSAMIAQEVVKEERHGIFFVGYLDPDTLGYQLLHANKGDKLQFSHPGPDTAVQLANIHWFHFSAHAPREALRHIIKEIRPRNIVFVHGDPEAIDWMAENVPEVEFAFAPETGDRITVEG